MRLKEPLMGIDLMQGHFVMHMAMFCVSFYVDVNFMTEADKAKFIKDHDATTSKGFLSSFDAFYKLRWTHFFIGVSIFTEQALKFNLKHDLAVYLKFANIIYY